MFETNVPGRPVVAKCGMPADRISEFVDCNVNPKVKCLPSVFVDSSDFLRRLEHVGYKSEMEVFGTLDVAELNPHILHVERLVV